MEAVVRKINRNGAEGPDVVFFCPGCKCGHAVWITPNKSPSGGTWTWNGDLDKPTFQPSLLITYDPPPDRPKVCHSNVTDGMIHFHGDSTHSLTGQTVKLEKW